MASVRVLGCLGPSGFPLYHPEQSPSRVTLPGLHHAGPLRNGNLWPVSGVTLFVTPGTPLRNWTWSLVPGPVPGAKLARFSVSTVRVWPSHSAVRDGILLEITSWAAWTWWDGLVGGMWYGVYPGPQPGLASWCVWATVHRLCSSGRSEPNSWTINKINLSLSLSLNLSAGEPTW
jgi:hypothetical protein